VPSRASLKGFLTSADYQIDMFEWKPEYSVQIPEIDAQHQKLFALAGELHTFLKN